MIFYGHGKEINYSRGEVWDPDGYFVFPRRAEKTIRAKLGCRCPNDNRRCEITGSHPHAFRDKNEFWY